MIRIDAKQADRKTVKPIVIFTVDGGPDENPRYQKVIDVAIHHFVQHDLDTLFVAKNAPGPMGVPAYQFRVESTSYYLA